MKYLRALFAVALVLVLAAPAFAETQNVKVSGSLDAYWIYRSNYDLLDNNDSGAIPVGTAVPGQGGSDSFLSNRSEGDDFFMSITQIGVSADLTDNVSTVINVINQRDWNSTTFVGSESTSLSANDAVEFDIDLDLAYVQMKEIFYSPLTLTIGRQDLLFGRGFIVGWNPTDFNATLQAEEFTQSQAFDAIRATLDFSPWTLDFVYAKINERAHDPEDDRDLYIVNVNYKFAEYNAVAEAYYMPELDRATLAGTSGTHDNDTHTIGARAQFDPISQITLGAEAAYQFGDYRASVSAPERDRDAWGVDIFGEYRWDNTWKPMLGIQYVYLSGEEDLGSGSTQEYGAWNGPFRGPIYGWIHDYLETYYATSQADDQSTGQNNEFICLYGNMKPMDDLQLNGSFYYFWTPERVHQVSGNLASPTESEELGFEIDTSIVYSYTEDVTFTFMADWFIPGDFYNHPNDATASQYVTEVKVVF